ncbi:MAG: 3'-5' exonuclease [Dysgonamonadaceae bacterium]|nr:3'-5' exonuclease domain-containing protein 2 [Dysgonamonadaceae bacterium]MDD3308614.1 3'-5' exonuclease domain-containing protein 2 [Dysgonamonadaceae bacterium]MDD3900715.1 3'-5' exonuclease domain-containing protein 2 [Dysgonamonadaceae bacterium]MDD4398279.1 3'-5' exonuclease domain-containing protein 2 [Dysgonamonadaceae bacterium]MEA5080669.1 3'-5' exonuclease [Dysgonamonadaceae bacterium]
MGLTITKLQIAELPIEKFEGEIIVVDKLSQVQSSIDFLKEHAIIGFDTETKPSFKRGQTHKVALMQLSTEDVCFLFRLNKIGFPKELNEVLCSQEIVKIGLSLGDDFSAIHKRSDEKPKNFIDLQGFVDKYDIDDNSLQKIYAIIFGKKISKNQRLSNWEADTLSEAQKAYAAIDAWACLKIYNHLIRIDENDK